MNRLTAWFAENRVAANLLMLLILAGGGLTAFQLRQEVFPELSSEMISVTVPYPGAAPEEVEDGVVTRVEDAIQGVEGIQEITSTASEGVGTVRAEILEGADIGRVLSDVENRVAGIASFPEEAEEPIVQELVIRRQVINVAVSGRVGERTLKEIGRQVRDDLAARPAITQVELEVARPYEVSIELPERTLRAYGLTLEGVAQAVRRGSLDLPGGSIETEGGEILLRTQGQAYAGRQFERIPLVTRPDGSRLLLGDVATVVDGFADTDQAARFDGEPAVLVKVFRVGDQDAIEVAETVERYVAEAGDRLPEGVTLTLWQDDTAILKSRRDLLVENGAYGLALVLLVLATFLRLRLAGWVALGIPISFLGAIAFMPTLDVTINMISLFAFIVVLGIVVDDAIVVGENIYTHYQKGGEGLSAVLAFSLVESLLILPAHLSKLYHERGKKRSRASRAWRRFQDGFADRLDRFIHRGYEPSLEWALELRYLTLAIALAVLVLVGGLVGGGWIRFTFLPSVEADNVVALLTMPQGTPTGQTASAVARLEEAARELEREIEEETGDSVFRHVLASTGQQPFRTAQGQNAGGTGGTFSGAHLGEVNIKLVGSERREITSQAIADRWRATAGAIPDAVELTFTASLFSVGEAIDVRLTGDDLDRLQAAADELKAALGRYAGVYDVSDSFRMLDFVNRSYRAATRSTAIREAGKARFRPILLTSLTTFAGLTPLLLEQSLQAQFLIPMAVSLAFGVLFATVITLILVPVLYGIFQDVKVVVAKAVGKGDDVRPPLGEEREGEDDPDDHGGGGDGGGSDYEGDYATEGGTA